MTNKQERIVYLLMALNAITFLFVFLLVSRNYRLAADDFHYLIKSKELGVWQSMQFYYHNWNPRWSATLITNFVLGNYTSPTTLFTFHLSSLIFGFVAIRSFLAGIIRQLTLPFTKVQQIIISLYLLAALFYGSFSKDDTWFWITVNPMYLWGSFAAFLGGSLIIKKWFYPLRIALVGLLFLYAGGASETVAISTIITLFFLGFVTHRAKFLIQIDRTALHVATICCAIGFGIDISGAGANIRYEHLPQHTLTNKLTVGFWNYTKFALKEIPLTLPIIILFTSPFAFFGRKQLRFQLIELKQLIITNRKLWGLADLLIIALAFALAFSMGEMGPKRAWTSLTFIVLLIAVTFSYQLGTWIYIKSKGKLFILVLVTQIILLSYQTINGYSQIRITTHYANAVDERMQEIELEQQTKTSIIELTPLPNSGWLFSSEISSDTAYFTNKHLRLFFGNKHRFIKKDSVNSSSE